MESRHGVWSATTVVLLIIITMSEVVGDSQAVAGNDDCLRQCGDVHVPYPFGIGSSECYLDSGFGLTCNNTFDPPKPFVGEFEVTSISIESHQTTIKLGVVYLCYVDQTRSQYIGLNLNNSPFRFSTENVFTAVGCDTWAFITGTEGRNYTGGCISTCQDPTNVIDGSCTGMGCCQTQIPQGVRSYEISFKSGNNHSDVLSFNPCSYAFLVSNSGYTFKTSDLTSMSKESTFPVLLDWAIGNETCEEAQKNTTSYACLSNNSVCVNSTNDPGYYCNCSKGFYGNPYLKENGCKDINECEDPKTYPCNGTCINKIGSYECVCPEGTTGDPTKYACTLISKAPSPSVKVWIVVPVVVLTSLLAIAVCIWIYTLLQRRRLLKLSEQHFKDNGGEELHEKLLMSASGSSGTTGFKLFTREEMEEATLNYDNSRILGRGGQGVVYKGIIAPDDTVIAVKRSIKVDKSKVKDFVNEIAVLSQINHRNVVKLLGCCLETEEPLLVYEYVPNGTLSQHIKRNSYLNWEVRLKIASEIASALGSLHSSTPIRIIHRDVKSCNVLLDDDYTAKVADFGTAVLVPENKVLIAAMIMGTFGYIDPEYLQTQRLTEKSDVYSFGVILVELLTGMEPYAACLDGVEQGERSLAKRFSTCMKAKTLDQILDSSILRGSSMTQIEKVARLAMQCLSMKGEDRPSMMDVAMELNGLRGANVTHPWGNFDEQAGAEEMERLVSGSEKSTTTSFPPNVNYAGDMFKTIAMENVINLGR